MRKLMTALLCIVISVASFAADTPVPDNTLTVSGFFMKKKNVSYEICLVNEDSTCTPLTLEKGVFQYSVDLEIGKEYVIRFTKDGQVKELYIIATEPGEMDLDVDFNNSNSAVLSFNVKENDYIVSALIKPKYELRSQNNLTGK